MGRKAIPIEPYIDKLEQAILMGATYKLAALYAGISKKTFERWRKQAEKALPSSPFALLWNRLRQAEGRAAVGWLAKIEKAATDGDWRAAAWKLERRCPETFGVRAQVDLTVDIRRVAQRVATEMGVDVDELLAEAQALLKEADEADHP